MYNKIELLSYLIDFLYQRKFNGIEIKRETLEFLQLYTKRLLASMPDDKFTSA